MSNSMPIASPVRTQAIVNRYFMHAKKNLGQNFLVDLAAIKGIVEAADIQPGDQVIEIGPGIGSLTEQLLLAGAKVLAYEVDQDLPEILKNELPQKVAGEELSNRFKLVMKDVLKANFTKDSDGFLDLNKSVKIVANLPYYITTPIIFNLIKSNLAFSSLTLMMQKEVAERLVAKPKTKEYVASAVVVLTPLTEKPDIDDYSFFDHVVKMCFAQRRKTLANNLKSLVKDRDMREKMINDLGLDLRVRPEELTLNQFVELAHLLKDQQA